MVDSGPAGGAPPRTRAEKVCCASEKGHHTINLVPVAAVPLHRLGSLQGPCIASAQSLMNLRPLGGLGIRSAEAVSFSNDMEYEVQSTDGITNYLVFALHGAPRDILFCLPTLSVARGG